MKKNMLIWFGHVEYTALEWVKEWQKRFMTEKWAVREVGEIPLDLRKHSIEVTGGRSRKKYEEPEGMYEEVDDSGRGERAMQVS